MARDQLDDTTDTAAPAASAESNQWKRGWRDMHGPTVQRPTRGFAFKLRHAALPCGALRVHNIPGLPHTDAFCTHEGCDQRIETYTHLFLECPAVQPIIDWLCDVGEAIAGSRPPANAAVIIAADPGAWAPQGRRAQELWMVLRLNALQLIWARRCRRNIEQTPLTAAGVAAMVVHTVRDQILGEWRRVKEDVTDMTGVCKSWFRGMSVVLKEEEFKRRWCANNALCSVEEGIMTMHFSLSLPVPIFFFFMVDVLQDQPLGLSGKHLGEPLKVVELNGKDTK